MFLKSKDAIARIRTTPYFQSKCMLQRFVVDRKNVSTVCNGKHVSVWWRTEPRNTKQSRNTISENITETRSWRTNNGRKVTVDCCCCLKICKCFHLSVLPKIMIINNNVNRLINLQSLTITFMFLLNGQRQLSQYRLNSMKYWTSYACPVLECM